FHQLHHDEVAFPAVGTGDALQSIDRADVGMVEGAGSARLTTEALEHVRIGAHLGGEELDGYHASEVQVLGSVDDAHTAATYFSGDAVMSDGLSDHALRGM